MDSLQPIIKAISAVAWDGAPVVSDAPFSHDCYLEIGAADDDQVDYFTLTVANRAWAAANLEETEIPAAPAWLAPRAILLSDAPSFRAVTEEVGREIAALGPYPTWPDFAKRLGSYLRWDLEGAPYPPFL